MAQRTQVVFIGDIDGSEAAESVRFGLAGTTYEVDLSAKTDKLARIFEPYIAATRKTGGNTRRIARSPRAAGPSPQEVRTWARAQSIDVKDKGRVPAELIVASRRPSRTSTVCLPRPSWPRRLPCQSRAGSCGSRDLLQMTQALAIWLTWPTSTQMLIE
jgi:hypothetical protein